MSNQRRSSRFPVSAVRMHCELRLGSQVIPAMLLNESSSGFGVLVGKIPSISRNQRAQLHTDCGWFDCRIVHATEVAPAKAISGVEAAPAKAVQKSSIWGKGSSNRDTSINKRELFDGDGTFVKDELFKGDIAILATDDYGCEEEEENDGSLKCVDDDLAAKGITVADIQEFTAGMEGPWFRLGIRCLGKIAPPTEPASALPVADGHVGPAQWVKNVLGSVFGR